MDMARYLGPLTDPNYTDAGLVRLRGDPVARRKALEKALDKTKVFLRLVDAYLVAHDEGEERGNDLYHERQERAGRQGREGSYHLQISQDVDRLVQAAADGRTTTLLDGADDARLIRDMADIKMKELNPSPWSVIPGGEGPDGPTTAALDRAEAMVRRMQELTPVILGYTASKWQAAQEAALADGSQEARNRVISEVGRVTTTLRNANLDNAGGSPFMVPPDPSISDPAERRRLHEQAIRNSRDAASSRRTELDSDMEAVRRDSDPSLDIVDIDAKDEVENKLTRREEALSRMRGQVALEEWDTLLPWVQYLNSLVLRALVPAERR
jgi:hypothetical protein